MATQTAKVPAPAQEEFRSAVGMLKLLGDETRLRVIWALLGGEHSVNELAELVGAQPAAVSQHLAKLRLARLVRSRREGTRIYYVVDDAHVRRLVEEVLSARRPRDGRWVSTTHPHAHAHGSVGGSAADRRRPGGGALVLLVVFMAFEVGAAVFSNSLVLLADAGHMLVDVGAIAGSLIAIRLAARPETGSHTYGLKRAEILAAAGQRHGAPGGLGRWSPTTP